MAPATGAPCSSLGAVSALPRVSSLKKAVDQRNRALTRLNEAMNVSCTLLSSQKGRRPVSCTTSATWSRLGLRDVLTATCLLENRSAFGLGPGWALCVQVLPSSHASDLASAGSAVTYTLPVGQLGPGGRWEMTLPLGPGEDGVLDLPVTVSYMLFYSLREVVGGALAPSGSFRDPSLDRGASDIAPEQEGVCLPLGEHTVDLLQALRFPGLATPCTPGPGPLGPARDPVDTFLAAQCRPGSEPAGLTSLRAKHLPPSAAAIRVSAELLRAALGDRHSGGWRWLASLWPRGPGGCGRTWGTFSRDWPRLTAAPPPAGATLCCAALQWLLADNAAADVVRACALASVQGVAPDGADVHLTAREVGRVPVCRETRLDAVVLSGVPTPALSGWLQKSPGLGPPSRGLGPTPRLTHGCAGAAAQPPEDRQPHALHTLEPAAGRPPCPALAGVQPLTPRPPGSAGR